jgi:hypothetical protein
MTDATRGVLRLLLALGYAAGAVLVILLLAKGNADALAARTSFTALSVIVLGLIAIAGLRLMERSNLDSLWGYATVLVAAATFVLVVVEIWSEGGSRNPIRVEVMLVISGLLGGGALALSGEDRAGVQAIRITRAISLLALITLGALTVLSVADVHIGPRWFGVVSAIFLVSALSLPVRSLLVEGEGRAGS